MLSILLLKFSLWVKQVGGSGEIVFFGYDVFEKKILGEGGDFQEKFFLMMVSQNFFFPSSWTGLRYRKVIRFLLPLLQKNEKLSK